MFNCIEGRIDLNPMGGPSGLIPAQTLYNGGGTYKEDNFIYARRVNVSPPLTPQVNFDPLSFNQAVDHAALIVSHLLAFNRK